MTKPIITLKNIDIHTKLSQETPAYTARVFVDGKYFCNVENGGYGGPDNQWIEGESNSEAHVKINELDKLVRDTYPKTDLNEKYNYNLSEDKRWMDETLECLCHGLAWKHVEERNLRSRLSRKVLALDPADGKVYIFGGKKSPAMIEAVKERNPTYKVLNEMPFAKAFEIFRNA